VLCPHRLGQVSHYCIITVSTTRARKLPRAPSKCHSLRSFSCCGDPPLIARYYLSLTQSNSPRPQEEQARSVSCASAQPREICHASNPCLYHRPKIQISHAPLRNLQVQSKFHIIIAYIAPCKCCRTSPLGAGRDRGSRRSQRGGVVVGSRTLAQREFFAC
jgi:hypothetical protein